MSESAKVIQDLFEKIIGPFAAAHCGPLILEPGTSEERVGLLFQTFQEHPHLISPFEKLIKSIKPNDENSALEEKIRFYTTKHTRDWLIVVLINEVLNVKELKLDLETGRLPGKPQELLQFAIAARDAFGEESRYKDFAFAAGLYFDFLFYLQKSTYLNLGQIKFDEPMKEAFTQSIELAQKILVLSKHKSRLSLEKLAPITVMFRALSQVTLWLLRPHQAPEFYKINAATPAPETVLMYQERQKFGLPSSVIASFLAESIPALSPLGEVMSVWGFPYLSWIHSHRDIHDLSALALLGVTGQKTPELSYLDFALTEEIKNEAKL